MLTFDCKSSACTACLSAATPRLRSERHSGRHRNQEFIEFLEQFEASAPAGQDIRAVLDNYAAHKHGAVNEWLGKHDRWGFHSAPTSCSWLKVVEGFLGKPARRRLRRGVHDSIEQLEKTILDFIELHNGKEAKPFCWTSSPERLIAARQRGTQALRTNHWQLYLAAVTIQVFEGPRGQLDSLRDRVVEVQTSFVQCPFSMESLRTIPVGAFGYAAGLGLDCPHPAPSRALVGLLMSVAGQTGISKHPPTCAGMLQRTAQSMNTDLEKLSSKQRTRIRSAADIPADAYSVSVSLEGVIVQLMKGEAVGAKHLGGRRPAVPCLSATHARSLIGNWPSSARTSAECAALPLRIRP